MAGRFSIQKVPRGLLSLFDMKGTGQNPVELGQIVQPVVDVTEAYSSQLLAVRAQDTVTAAGQTVDIAVPAGERWRLLSIMVGAISTDPADDINCWAGVRLPGVTNPQHDIALTDFMVFGNLESLHAAGRPMPQPFWLDPGSLIRAWVSDIAATGTLSLIVGGVVQILRD